MPNTIKPSPGFVSDKIRDAVVELSMAYHLVDRAGDEYSHLLSLINISCGYARRAIEVLDGYLTDGPTSSSEGDDDA